MPQAGAPGRRRDSPRAGFEARAQARGL